MLEDYDTERKPCTPAELKPQSPKKAKCLKVDVSIDDHRRVHLSITRPGDERAQEISYREFLASSTQSKQDREIIKIANAKIERLGDELRKSGKLPPLRGRKLDLVDDIRKQQDAWVWTLQTLAPGRQILVALDLPRTDESEDEAGDRAPLRKWLSPAEERRPFGPLKTMTEAEFNALANGPYAARSVLPNELVLDFDTRDPAKLEAWIERVRTLLRSWGLKFYELPTGGKGKHIHVFLEHNVEVPEDVAEKIGRYDERHPKAPYDPCRFIRLWFFNKILTDASVPQAKPGAEGLDPAPVRWSRNGKGAMIRIAGCKRDNGRTKTLDPTGERLILPRYQPRLNGFGTFSELVFRDMASDLDKRLQRPPPPPELCRRGVSIGCINGWVEMGAAEGVRHEEALRLATLMRDTGVPRDEAEELMARFSERCENASESQARENDATLRSVYGREPDPELAVQACAYLRRNKDEAFLKHCCSVSCPLRSPPGQTGAEKAGAEAQRVDLAADELSALKDGTWWTIVNEAVDESIAGEPHLRRMVIYSCLSAGLKDHRLHLLVIGDSQTGKSHVLRSIGSKLFEDIFIDVSTMSSKGLYYAADAAKDPRLFDGKILFVDELADQTEQTRDTLKALMSNGATGARNLTVDEHKHSRDQKLEGLPVVQCTSAEVFEDAERQLMNRPMVVNPDESREQTAKVLSFQRQAASVGAFRKAGSRVPQAKRLLSKIMEVRDVEVCNAFAHHIRISPEDSKARNTLPMFFKLVAAITYAHRYGRPMVELPDGRKVLFASYEDNVEAAELWAYASGTKSTGLPCRHTELHAVLPDRVDGEEGLDVEQITELYNKRTGKTLSVGTVQNYLSELSTANLASYYVEKTEHIDGAGNIFTRRGRHLWYRTTPSLAATSASQLLIGMDTEEGKKLLDETLELLKTTSSHFPDDIRQRIAGLREDLLGERTSDQREGER